MTKIVERIERQAGISGLVSILADRLSPTDLQSLLLEVYRIRSRRLEPAAVLADYESDRFVRPAGVSPVSLLKWEQAALAHLPPEVTPLALSPVCPLGTNSAVAGVTQDWAVTTVRNTEVVSDSTGVLALECAARRRALCRANPRSAEEVHLAASHRLLRAQHYDSPHNFAHFGLFALCSAGRDRGNLQFELAALRMHIRFYLVTLQDFVGPTMPLELSITNLGPEIRTPMIEAQLLAVLQSEFGQVPCGWDQERASGRGYYMDLCFHIHGTASQGRRMLLVDGGSVDWTQKLLSNGKERLITSGIGSERLCTMVE